MKPEIILTDYGIASRQGDTIFINRKLLSDADLYDAIIQHELEHTSGYSVKDIALDLNIKQLRGLKGRYWSFILKNPSTWIEFSPIYLRNRKISINPLLIAIYGLILLFIGGFLWFLPQLP